VAGGLFTVAALGLLLTRGAPPARSSPEPEPGDLTLQ
jgi:hypothetical protein